MFSFFLRKINCNNQIATRLLSSTLNVAIVGAGPSGLYTSKYLRSSFLKNSTMKSLYDKLEIDVIERLPVPFGLVRFGVAPDHSEVKNVENDFVSLFSCDNDKVRINFLGNVTVGVDISLDEISKIYDVVVLAYGCEADKNLCIEGETLTGVLSAREFVGWYNGHPDFVNVGDKISNVISNPDEAKVVIIGQGNVAIDCARILAKGNEALKDSDIITNALNLLQNGVKNTTIVGRRGHVQGAFTIKELRELTKLKDSCQVDFKLYQKELDLGTTESTRNELTSPAARPKVRIDKLLRETASKQQNLDFSSSAKKISLRFLLSPLKFLPHPKHPTQIGYVLCERTKLVGEPFQQKAVGTGETIKFGADLVIVSIGYKSIPLIGMNEEIFDSSRGKINNIRGKVNNNFLYTSGWLKRGPHGIIGTNIPDAKETVDTIIQDLIKTKDFNANDQKTSLLNRKIPRKELLSLLQLRNVHVVDWESYKKIDLVERNSKKRRSVSQPRDKITSIEEFLSII